MLLLLGVPTSDCRRGKEVADGATGGGGGGEFECSFQFNGEFRFFSSVVNLSAVFSLVVRCERVQRTTDGNTVES